MFLLISICIIQWEEQPRFPSSSSLREMLLFGHHYQAQLLLLLFFCCCPLFTKELEKSRTLPACSAMRMVRRASSARENQNLYCGYAFSLLPFHVGYTTGHKACLLIHKSLYPRNYAQEAAPQALDQEASPTGRPYLDTFETVPPVRWEFWRWEWGYFACGRGVNVLARYIQSWALSVIYPSECDPLWPSRGRDFILFPTTNGTQ